jgi:hypothetical protein
MQKHAYMIIAHNEFDLLEILVRLLDDPRNDIYVHIDAKVKDFDFKSFQALTQYSRLRFTPRRISATWGDFSLVNTELLLLQTAVAGEDPAQPYAYYHLISAWLTIYLAKSPVMLNQLVPFCTIKPCPFSRSTRNRTCNRKAICASILVKKFRFLRNK